MGSLSWSEKQGAAKPLRFRNIYWNGPMSPLHDESYALSLELLQQHLLLEEWLRNWERAKRERPWVTTFVSIAAVPAKPNWST